METGAQSWGGLADGRAWPAPSAALLGGVSRLELVNTWVCRGARSIAQLPRQAEGLTDAVVPVTAALRLPRREAAVFQADHFTSAA